MNLLTFIIVVMLFAVAGFLGFYTFMGFSVLMSSLAGICVAVVGSLLTVGIVTWLRKSPASEKTA